jgi:hypothetical protein
MTPVPSGLETVDGSGIAGTSGGGVSGETLAGGATSPPGMAVSSGGVSSGGATEGEGGSPGAAVVPLPLGDGISPATIASSRSTSPLPQLASDTKARAAKRGASSCFMGVRVRDSPALETPSRRNVNHVTAEQGPFIGAARVAVRHRDVADPPVFRRSTPRDGNGASFPEPSFGFTPWVLGPQVPSLGNSSPSQYPRGPTMKIPFHGRVTSVQPRIRLTRSFDDENPSPNRLARKIASLVS